jgi:dTDP-glucose 4,6-dehydratase
MRILITGGAGFQGSHITKMLLQAGHDVTVLNTPSAEAERNMVSFARDVVIVWGSVTDEEVVSKSVRGVDIVLHLAARINVDESIGTPRSFIDVNVLGTYHVLEAVRRDGKRLIYSSTCEVYGYSGDVLLTENSELKPYSPYGASKAGADRLCYAYYQTYGVNVTVLRPCNIYGEGQKTGKGGALIPIFANRAHRGLPLTVFGDGLQRREYLHVTDLVEAYKLVINSQDLDGNAINIGSQETSSVKEIAEFINSRTGAPIEYLPARPGEVPGFQLDSTFARSIGFTPRIKFWDGLERYLDWALDNIQPA